MNPGGEFNATTGLTQKKEVVARKKKLDKLGLLYTVYGE